MGTFNLDIPAWEWYNWNSEKLSFPDKWIVEERNMKGHDKPALTIEKIKEKMQNPIGTNTLKKLAAGKRKCCIIFDDLTRPTKTYQEMRRDFLEKKEKQKLKASPFIIKPIS